MSDVRFRVGASLDANVRTVFEPLEAAARRARKNIEKELGAAAKGIGGPYRTSARVAEDSFDHMAGVARKAGDKMVSDAERAARERVRANEKAEREFSRLVRDTTREFEREEKKRTAAAESEAKKREAATTRTARRVGYWSQRNFMPVTPTMGMAKGFAMDIARGAGVDLNVGSMMSDYVQRQSLATKIANTAYIPTGGTKAAGQLQDRHATASALLQQTTAIGKELGEDPMALLEGAQQFVFKTGDLDTAQKTMMELAKIAKATGTDMNQMMSAAGEISKQLPESSNKLEALPQIMRVLAGQGQVGAIDISQLANTVGKVAAQEGKFTLGADTKGILANQVGMSDEHGQRIAVMGALTQAVRQTGGKVTVGTATNAAMSFVRDLSSKSELKRLESEAHINAFADKDKTVSRDPKDIILDILSSASEHGKKSGIDKSAIARFVPNQNSRAVVEAFSSTYNEARKSGMSHTDSLDAVRKRFNDLLSVAQSTEQINDSFKARMEDVDSKAQVFKVRLQEIADQSASRLLPALEQLTPHIESAASAFAKMAEYATENPMQAVGIALGAAVAKAGIETALRTGIEKALTWNGGALGKAGGIASLAVTTIVVGEAIIDNFFAKKATETDKDVSGNISISNAIAKANAKMADGTFTESDAAELQKLIAGAEEQKEKQKKNAGISGAGYGAIVGGNIVDTLAFMGSFGNYRSHLGKDAEEGANAELRGQQDAIKATQKSIDDLHRTIQRGLRISAMPQPTFSRMDGVQPPTTPGPWN